VGEKGLQSILIHKVLTVISGVSPHAAHPKIVHRESFMSGFTDWYYDIIFVFGILQDESVKGLKFQSSPADGETRSVKN